MRQVILLDIRVPSVANAVVLLDQPVAHFVVQLIGGGVQRAYPRVVLVAIVIVEDGRLSDGHADDGAAVLVRAARASVAVAALGAQQYRRDVVNLVGGLRAGALLGDPATLAPSVAGVQD